MVKKKWQRMPCAGHHPNKLQPRESARVREQAMGYCACCDLK